MPNNQVYISPSDLSSCYITYNDRNTITSSNLNYYTVSATSAAVEDSAKIKKLEDEIVTLKEIISNLLNKQQFED